MKTLNLKKYVGRVKSASGKLSSEYVDWFTDDDAARDGYRAMMREQGCQVKSITIENQSVIVEIHP